MKYLLNLKKQTPKFHVDNKIVQTYNVGDLNIKSVIIRSTKRINNQCVKNNKFLYFVLSNFSAIEKILITAKSKNKIGFAYVRNPYLYGEVSISRTARDFPSIFIFKPLIVLSALFCQQKNQYIFWLYVQFQLNN